MSSDETIPFDETGGTSAPLTREPITRRDMFAAAALAGILANPECDGTPADVVIAAKWYADQMMEVIK